MRLPEDQMRQALEGIKGLIDQGKEAMEGLEESQSAQAARLGQSALEAAAANLGLLAAGLEFEQ